MVIERGGEKQVNKVVKSPLDMTIYSPGLRKLSNEDVSLIEKISNFVESIRLDGKNRVSHFANDDNRPSCSGIRSAVNSAECMVEGNLN